MVEVFSRNKCRVVVLVLASDNRDIYLKFREVWYSYLNLFPQIKVYLVYGKTSKITPRSNDLIYEHIPESYYPGMITKTLNSIEYIHNTYSYDFLLRTNLSTFWDFERLLLRLNNLSTDCITGTIRHCKYKAQQSPAYVSGVNLIIPNNLVEVLITNREKIISWDLPEDWSLSKAYIDKGIPLKPSIPGCIHFMEKFKEPDKLAVLKQIKLAKEMNHDHFRIKNMYNRTLIDPHVANILLTEYYGKTIL